MGISHSTKQEAANLAKLAKDSGLDGVVCSAHEVNQIKQQLGQDFLCITPGIRFQTSPSDDQHRIMTPSDAISVGADYLVVGRPITQAENPLKILEKINIDINK